MKKYNLHVCCARAPHTFATADIHTYATADIRLESPCQNTRAVTPMCTIAVGSVRKHFDVRKTSASLPPQAFPMPTYAHPRCLIAALSRQLTNHQPPWSAATSGTLRMCVRKPSRCTAKEHDV